VADRARFEGFFRKHFSRVTRACALVLLDPAMAEDVASEAFARLWARWGQIEGDDHAGGYVFKTAMRLCWRRARTMRREARRAVPDLPGPDEIGRSLDRTELFEALALLPIRERQTVTLRD
jgi:DNA-directed RNA polymerase specialized sigma24 family protein